MVDPTADGAAAAGSPMSQLPLETERLLLRPYRQGDTPEIARLLDDAEMARFLMVIPHPFVEFDARQLVKAAWRRLAAGRGFDLLITVKDDGDRLVGSVGVGLHDDGQRAELGFWIGRQYWGDGYATEATSRMLAFCMKVLGVTRFTATATADNAASLAVLRKLGFAETGSGKKRRPSTGKLQPVIYLEREGTAK